MLNHFYIIANELKDKDLKVSRRIADYLAGKGKSCLIATSVSPEEVGRFAPDCVLVVGGDGTMIRSARQLRKCSAPLLGINMGTVGYLTEVDPDNLYQELDLLLAGQYSLEERMMLRCVFPDGSKETALNDVVLTRTGALHVITFNIYVNGKLLNTYSADGCIVSTPTGSTGYNLSAGGPIVEPTAELIVLTPICSHALNTSSIVLSSGDVLRIEICPGRHPYPARTGISVDGNDPYGIAVGQSVEIFAAKETTKLLKINQVGFLDTLRSKMRGN